MLAGGRFHQIWPFAAALSLSLVMPGAARAQNGGLVQQLAAPLSAGDVAVSAFSGATLASPNLPAGVDPATQTVIDTNGISLRIFDLSTLGGPQLGQVVVPPVKLTVPSRDIGQVFGLTFDDGAGRTGTGTPNLYAAATSLFGLQITGTGPDGTPTRLKEGASGAKFMDGQIGSIAGGSPGAIWKIDGVTGAATFLADTAFSGVPNTGPGIGDLAFDRRSRNLYASDLDTGLIHRFDLELNAGSDLGQFDHGMSGRPGAGLPSVADDGKVADIQSPEFKVENPDTWGFTSPERRVNALAVRGGRLYYSVAAGPEIWSVELAEDGSFGTTARREVAVKADQPFAVTDIVFDGEGRMILAQRGTQKPPFDYGRFVEPAQAATMRYVPAPAGGTELWLPEPEEYAIGLPAGNRMGLGGVTLHRSFNPDGSIGASCEQTLLTTGEDLRNEPALVATIPPGPINVHGFQINDASLVKPANVPPLQSAFAAYDPNRADPEVRGHIGDIEAIPCLGVEGEPGLPPVIEGFAPPPLVFPEDFGPLNPLPGGGSFSLAKQALTDKCTEDGGCAFGITVFNPGPEPLPGPIQIEDVFTVNGAKQPDATIIGGPNEPWECTDGASINCIHPGPLPVGETVLTLNFKPGPLGDAKEVRNCVALPGQLDDDLPPVIEEGGGGKNDGDDAEGGGKGEGKGEGEPGQGGGGKPDGGGGPNKVEPNDPAVPADPAPAPAPAPAPQPDPDQPKVKAPPPPAKESEKDGLLVKTTPVNPDTCSAAKGDCLFKIELINTGQTQIKGPLELSQSLSLEGGAAASFNTPSQQLPAGVQCKFEAQATNCTGADVTIPPGGTISMTLGVSPTISAGSKAGFVTNQVTAKIGALGGTASASHGFIDAPKDEPGGNDGDDQPGDGAEPLPLDQLPPEQCATIPVEDPDPDGGGGGKGEENPNEGGGGKEQTVGGLTISKSAAAGVVSCKDTDDCKFSIPVKNATNAPIAGQIEITETVTGDGALFGATAVSSGPNAPWTCVKAGQAFKCTHPGPIAAGASADLNVGFKLGAGSAAKEIKNCATLQAAETGVCATVPTAPPPPDPNAKPNLILEKIRDTAQCSDAGGGCKFKITVLNRGPADFEGPLVIEDKVTDEADKIFVGTELDDNARIVGQDGVTGTMFCNKVAPNFKCATIPAAPAKIPAGKSLEINVSFKLGTGTNAKEIKNCANIEGQAPVCASIPLVNGPLLRAFKVSAANTCVPKCAYGVSIKNVGNAPAKGPFVLDEIFTPATSFKRFETIDGDFFCSNGALGKAICTSTKGPIEPGRALSLRVLVQGENSAPEYQNCVNIRPIQGNAVDAAASERCFTIKDTAPPKPNIAVTKRAPNAAGNGVGTCGLTSCRFVITVENNGSAPFVGDLIIKDSIPNVPVRLFVINQVVAQGLGAKCFASPGGIAGNQASCTFTNVTIPPNTRFDIEAAASPGQGALKKNNIMENCAEAEIAKGEDSDRDDNRGCAKVKLDPFNVKVEKSGGQNCKAGGDCTFALSLFNPGPIDHDDPVVLSDKLDIGPAQITSSNIPATICASPPTQVPFSCTSPGAVSLPLGGPPMTFTITVKMPETAQQYTNCASVAPTGGGGTGPVVRATGGTPAAGGGAKGGESCVSASLSPKDPGTGGSNTTKPGEEPTPPPVTPPPPPIVTPPPAQCFAGMAPDGAGRCACPAGTKFNGRQCASVGVVTPPPVTRPPVTIPCPAGTFGTYPNCKVGSGGSNGTVQTPDCPRGTTGVYPNCRVIQVTPPPTCPRGTSGVFPNCRTIQPPRCPSGTVGIYPNCRVAPTGPGTGGSNQVNPGDDRECPPGTAGRFPRCRPIETTPPPQCPPGTVGRFPRCRAVEPDRPECPEGTIGRYPRCRPIEVTPPRECPEGTIGRFPRCRPIEVTPPQQCRNGQIGTPPNCYCPAGTRPAPFGRQTRCVRDEPRPEPQPQPDQSQRRQCGDGSVGRWPRCRCTDGGRFISSINRCVGSRPDPVGPSPKPTPPPPPTCRGDKVLSGGECRCPSGLKDIGGNRCDIIVR